MIAEWKTYANKAPHGWDDMVSRLGGPIFHTTLWADYQKETYQVQPVFLLARDQAGGACAGGLALVRQSQRPLLSHILRDVMLPAHPFLREADKDVADAFMLHCEQWARSSGCARLTLNSFMSGASPFAPSGHGYAEERRVEFALDLERDLDSLWQGIRKDQRERIRRLSRQGVTIEEGYTQDDLRDLGAAREATQSRRSARGQGYTLPVDDEFYEGLYEYLVRQSAARLFVARRDGEVLAALLFVTFNGHAYSLFSGSNVLGYRLGAQSGLFWTAVETFKAGGFSRLNRGGVPASAEEESDPLHGIYLFKMRLGTTVSVCRSGWKVLSPLRDQLARMRARF